MHRKVDGGRTRMAKAPTYLLLPREKQMEEKEVPALSMCSVIDPKNNAHQLHTHVIF